MSILFSAVTLMAVKLPGVPKRAALDGRGAECYVGLDDAGILKSMSRADWERWSCQFAMVVHLKCRCLSCAAWHSRPARTSCPSVLEILSSSSLVVSWMA